MARRRKSPLTGDKTIGIAIDTSSLDRFIANIGLELEDIAIDVAAAGAKVIYDEVHANVDGMGRKTGNLKKSIYRVYSKTSSRPGKAVYHISWNHRKAPHGRLLEWGWQQRYKTYIGSDGNWYTAVRPHMRGKKKPGRNASIEVKDAYYVPLEGGPKQRPGYGFIRRAESAAPRAVEAMLQQLSKSMGNV